jgi:hypothetical protein
LATHKDLFAIPGLDPIGLENLARSRRNIPHWNRFEIAVAERTQPLIAHPAVNDHVLVALDIIVNDDRVFVNPMGLAVWQPMRVPTGRSKMTRMNERVIGVAQPETKGNTHRRSAVTPAAMRAEVRPRR